MVAFYYDGAVSRVGDHVRVVGYANTSIKGVVVGKGTRRGEVLVRRGNEKVSLPADYFVLLRRKKTTSFTRAKRSYSRRSR